MARIRRNERLKWGGDARPAGSALNVEAQSAAHDQAERAEQEKQKEAESRKAAEEEDRNWQPNKWHRRFIERFANCNWIGLAKTHAFWQCRRCGWSPLVPGVYEWFAALPASERREIVAMTWSEAKADDAMRRMPALQLEAGIRRW